MALLRHVTHGLHQYRHPEHREYRQRRHSLGAWGGSDDSLNNVGLLGLRLHPRCPLLVAIVINAAFAPLLALLGQHGRVLDVAEASVTLGVDGPEVGAHVSEAVVRAGYCLYALVPSHQSLEDLFVSIVEAEETRAVVGRRPR